MATVPRQMPDGLVMWISYVAPRHMRVMRASVQVEGRHGSILSPSTSGFTPNMCSHTFSSVQQAVPVAQECEPSPGRPLSGA